jgi:hypothetical protein
MSSRRSVLIEAARSSRKLAHRCEAALRLPWRKMLLYSRCRSCTTALGATAAGHTWPPSCCCARQLSVRQLSAIRSPSRKKDGKLHGWGGNADLVASKRLDNTKR